jgi:hypothetical protein
MATKNAPHTEVKHTEAVKQEKPKVKLIKSTELKPKQSFINLDSGNEEKIEVKSERFELVPFTGDVSKHFDGDKNAFLQAALEQAAAMVSPVTEQIEAFLKYATSQSYQDGKKSALSSGNYLSEDVKSAISRFMGNLSTYSELTAKERFERWSEGYKQKKPGAVAILEKVMQATDEDAFSGL